MLTVKVNSTIGVLRSQFSSQFPFLRLEFYTTFHPRYGVAEKKNMVADEARLISLDQGSDVEFEITDQMPVADLERHFREKFGLGAQVYRRYGNVWLETSVTDDWTLRHQNDHAREVSDSVRRTGTNG